MSDKDRKGPRERSPRPSKPMGGQRRGDCTTKTTVRGGRKQ